MLKSGNLDGGNLLSKLLSLCSKFLSMSIDMVRDMLYFGQPIKLLPQDRPEVGIVGSYSPNEVEEKETKDS